MYKTSKQNKTKQCTSVLRFSCFRACFFFFLFSCTRNGINAHVLAAYVTRPYNQTIVVPCTFLFFFLKRCCVESRCDATYNKMDKSTELPDYREKTQEILLSAELRYNAKQRIYLFRNYFSGILIAFAKESKVL